jgi:hypothetical protein
MGYFPANSNYYGSPVFYLLPFIEQQNLWNEVLQENAASNKSPVNPWNGSSFGYSLVVKTYICPSDPSMVNGAVPKAYTPPPAAGCSYAANVFVFGQSVVTSSPGTIPPTASVTISSGPSGVGGGSMIAGGSAIPASFPDGTSNTIMWTEKYGNCGSGGSIWSSTNSDGSQNFVPLIGLSGYPSYFQIMPTQGTCNYQLPSSGHTAAIQAGLGDGSVRTVSTGVSQNTWWMALIPNDGNVQPSDW